MKDIETKKHVKIPIPTPRPTGAKNSGSTPPSKRVSYKQFLKKSSKTADRFVFQNHFRGRVGIEILIPRGQSRFWDPRPVTESDSRHNYAV